MGVHISRVEEAQMEKITWVDRTVDQMINGAVEHPAHHLRFVFEKRRALGIE